MHSTYLPSIHKPTPKKTKKKKENNSEITKWSKTNRTFGLTTESEEMIIEQFFELYAKNPERCRNAINNYLTNMDHSKRIERNFPFLLGPKPLFSFYVYIPNQDYKIFPTKKSSYIWAKIGSIESIKTKNLKDDFEGIIRNVKSPQLFEFNIGEIKNGIFSIQKFEERFRNLLTWSKDDNNCFYKRINKKGYTGEYRKYFAFKPEKVVIEVKSEGWSYLPINFINKFKNMGKKISNRYVININSFELLDANFRELTQKRINFQKAGTKKCCKCGKRIMNKDFHYKYCYCLIKKQTSCITCCHCFRSAVMKKLRKSKKCNCEAHNLVILEKKEERTIKSLKCVQCKQKYKKSHFNCEKTCRWCSSKCFKEWKAQNNRKDLKKLKAKNFGPCDHNCTFNYFLKSSNSSQKKITKVNFVVNSPYFLDITK